jgi:AcrR family transcriptional regulator
VSGNVRRSSAEVRRLILQAAWESFSTQGYTATTTREIADAAGVTQAAILRHFGRKEMLFEAVLVQPLSDFVDRFVALWRDEPAWQGVSNEERTLRYVTELGELVRANRSLFAMLAGRNAPGRDPMPTDVAASLLSGHLDNFVEDLQKLAIQSGERTMDMGLAVRFTIALVLGLNLFDTTLFAPGGSLPQDKLDDGTAAFILRGVRSETA